MSQEIVLKQWGEELQRVLMNIVLENENELGNCHDH